MQAVPVQGRSGGDTWDEPLRHQASRLGSIMAGSRKRDEAVPAARQGYATSAETRLKLMLAAEELAARQGLSMLSAREIAKQAGLRNNVAVQYHFGSLENLLRDLVRHRQLQLDDLRSAMIEREGRPFADFDLYTLLKIFHMPHVHLIEKEGNSHYASFLCQHILTSDPLAYRRLQEHIDDMPALTKLLQAIRQKMDGVDAETISRRIGNCTILFLNVVRSLPPAAFGARPSAETGLLIKDTLLQCAAALSAPQMRDAADVEAAMLPRTSSR